MDQPRQHGDHPPLDAAAKGERLRTTASLAFFLAAFLAGALSDHFDPGPDRWDTRDFPHVDAVLIAVPSGIVAAALAVGLAFVITRRQIRHEHDEGTRP